MDEVAFIKEMREDYQLPPYLDDSVIKRAGEECSARLSFIVPGADFDTDKQGRMLLKNATYYLINHRYEDFEQNYADVIHSWQLGARYESK